RGGRRPLHLDGMRAGRQRPRLDGQRGVTDGGAVAGAYRRARGGPKDRAVLEHGAELTEAAEGVAAEARVEVNDELAARRGASDLEAALPDRAVLWAGGRNVGRDLGERALNQGGGPRRPGGSSWAGIALRPGGTGRPGRSLLAGRPLWAGRAG